MSCNHDFVVSGYNTAIVIVKCENCGEEKEYDYDDFATNYGAPF